MVVVGPMFPRPLVRQVVYCFLLLASTAFGLHIRVKDSAVVGEYCRVMEQDSLAVMNPAFSPDSELFTGIGWPVHETEWRRHYTLISPVHFIGAAHYMPNADWKLRFLGNDGVACDRGIKSMEVVVDSLGRATDLFIGTLSHPVDLARITPFPVLNLPTEEDYIGIEIVVFGQASEGMVSNIDGIWKAGLEPTQLGYFEYSLNGTDPAEIQYEEGDSGAPVLVMHDGVPSLVGTANSVAQVGSRLRNSFALVPAYLSEIDSIMEKEGYNLTKAILPEGLTIDVQSQSNGSLTQGRSGAVVFTVSNAADAEAHNVALTLAAGTPPDQISGPGWFTLRNADGTWSCRRANIAASGSSSLHAVWNAIPGALGLDAGVVADGAARVDLSSAPTVSVGSGSLFTGIGGTLGDTDRDGVGDLLEHAMGGDAFTPSALNVNGGPLRPTFRRAGNLFHYQYNRRISSFASGDYHLLEFSTNLRDWSGSLPPQTEIRTQSYGDAWPDFEQVTVSFPPSSATGMIRLRFTRSP